MPRINDEAIVGMWHVFGFHNSLASAIKQVLIFWAFVFCLSNGGFFRDVSNNAIEAVKQGIFDPIAMSLTYLGNANQIP